MSTNNALKERLVEEIVKLPDEKLEEVLDFVESLLRKEREAPVIKIGQELDPNKDPILKFIGGVSHGSLAKDIDKELYGE
jgi:hypothetical protein